MKLAQSHRLILAILLIAVCIGYATLSFAAPEVATALAAGFIGFVFLAFVVLRLQRKV